MYGAIDGVGSKPAASNPFIKKPGMEGVSENNPFTANKQDEDKTNFDPQKLFANNTVGLKKTAPENTIGVG